MPASPRPAPTRASRADGVRSRNASRLLPNEDAAALHALAAGLRARHAPADAVEAHWVEEIAFAMWRQRRLRAVEAAALARAEIGTNEPGAAARLPSLATLARYRARVERDLRLAEERLATAKRERPRLPAAAVAAATAPRLRWLADGLERNAAAAAANDDRGTNEPESAAASPASRNEPEDRPSQAGDAVTNEPERAGRGRPPRGAP